jgi:hypothetical protein
MAEDEGVDLEEIKQLGTVVKSVYKSIKNL